MIAAPESRRDAHSDALPTTLKRLNLAHSRHRGEFALRSSASGCSASNCIPQNRARLRSLRVKSKRR